MGGCDWSLILGDFLLYPDKTDTLKVIKGYVTKPKGIMDSISIEARSVTVLCIEKGKNPGGGGGGGGETPK